MAEYSRIAVYGLWHLGCVTAAGLAQAGFEVVGLDNNPEVIANLQKGQPPIFEPGLTDLVVDYQKSGQLTFTTDPAALREVSVLWVAFDTPVDEHDQADVSFVEHQLEQIFPYLKDNTIVIISSQLPVGTTDRLRQRWQERDPSRHLIYCYSPENLRLGNALKSFRAEDRIIVGLDDEEGKPALTEIFGRLSPRLEWMSVKSAEMTKHALNSFLAVSVAMINEIARICEYTGADAKEVERGLKSEARIGPKAYLGPGGPFAGGTLARDLRFLMELGANYSLETPLLTGALASNEIHKDWIKTTITRLLVNLPKPVSVSILGITYKPGTDTLRRSEAVNLGLWLVEQGAKVTFHDPVTTSLPAEFADKFKLTNNLEEVLAEADLLVVATGWPLYREEISPEILMEKMRHPIIIDQNRFLANQLNGEAGITYVAVGKVE